MSPTFVPLWLAASVEQAGAIGLFWADMELERMRRVDIDGVSNEDEWEITGTNPTGVRVDEEQEKVYWGVQTTDDGIFWSDYDGANLAEVVDTVNPFGMDVDSDDLFWGSYTGDDIRKADKTDGSGDVQLLSGYDNARGVVLEHLGGEHIYLQTGGNFEDMARIDKDGANFTSVADVDRGNGLDIDSDNEHLYYVSRDAITVRRIDFDGSNDTLIIDLGAVFGITYTGGLDLALDLAAGRIYVADWGDGSGTDTFLSFGLDGGDPQTLGDVAGQGVVQLDVQFPQGHQYAKPNR